MGTVLLVLVTGIWGSTFLVTRYVLKQTHPYTFLAFRFSFAAMLLLVLFNRRIRRVTRDEVIQGSGIGLILFSSLAMQTVGAPFTSASKAGFLVGLSIPAVPLLAMPVLRQLPTRGAILGISLSFLGLALVSMNGEFNLHVGSGEWLMLGAAITAAFHIVIISKYAPNADAINLAIVQIAVTAALSLVFVYARNEPRCTPAPSVVATAGMMGLFATAFTLVVMARVQQTVSSTHAALVYALEPVWAGGFGLLAGETLRASAWGGCGLIFAGIVVGTVRFSRISALPVNAVNGRERVG